MTASTTSHHPGSPRGAAGRAITVMEVVACAGHPLTLSEIGRRTHLSKATVHRLLAVLKRHGMVARCRHGYVLGPGTRRWHNRGSERAIANLRAVTTPHLIALQRATGLATALTVLIDHRAYLVDRLYDDRRLAYLLSWLAQAPVHQTPAGKVLLAYRPLDAECYLMDQGPNPGSTHSALASELASIRRTGVGSVRDERHRVHAIATVVWDRLGQAVGAMTIAGPDRAVHSRANVDALRRAAAATGADLRAGAAGDSVGHSAMAME